MSPCRVFADPDALAAEVADARNAPRRIRNHLDRIRGGRVRGKKREIVAPERFRRERRRRVRDDINGVSRKHRAERRAAALVFPERYMKTLRLEIAVLLRDPEGRFVESSARHADRDRLKLLGAVA